MDPRKMTPAIGTVEWYLALREAIIKKGYGHEIAWCEGVKPVASAEDFWGEFAWVVLNSGMKEQVARGIWNRVRPAVEGGASASTVFKHKGKAAAIDEVWRLRHKLFGEYQAMSDKMDYIKRLPWIGPITCFHLAKNYGFDCAKPDRHLARLSGQEGTHAMCERLAKATGNRIATVDLVIWRASNLRLPETLTD